MAVSCGDPVREAAQTGQHSGGAEDVPDPVQQPPQRRSVRALARWLIACPTSARPRLQAASQACTSAGSDERGQYDGTGGRPPFPPRRTAAPARHPPAWSGSPLWSPSWPPATPPACPTRWPASGCWGCGGWSTSSRAAGCGCWPTSTAWAPPAPSRVWSLLPRPGGCTLARAWTPPPRTKGSAPPGRCTAVPNRLAPPPPRRLGRGSCRTSMRWRWPTPPVRCRR